PHPRFRRTASLGQVGFDAAADGRQRRPKCRQTIELHTISHLAITLVVAILFAPLRVAAYRLNVAIRTGADPDGSPGGRDHQCPDACQLFVIADDLAVRTDVDEPVPGAPPTDTRTGFRYIPQS